MKIEARALSIGYNGRAIGSDLSLTVEPGEIVCLLGPNGCGKTTLFKTLLGLLPAIAGSVYIDGRPLGELKRAEVARALAYVPQAHVPPFPYSVSEVVEMGRTARISAFAAPGTRDRTAARQALDRLGISELANSDYSRLSGGQRQLVMIARALAQAAPVLVMDEPTASLDFGNQTRVLGHIRELARAGEHSVVLSTHDPDQAFALEASVVLMQEGR
ncbi:MAG: ABC transporter ATP-binding protein, partial [Wenzhouxiangella sp.]|nr:ABC transporter ATP-binding protein [Wenzhouxiangella sp.]